MRILLVHNRYRISGGEERHIDLLEEWLPPAGAEVRRFEVASPDKPSLQQKLQLGLSLAYRPAGARLLRGALNRYKPHVVHFHNVFPQLTPAAMLEARRHGAKIVLTTHNYRFACPAATLLRDGRIHEDCIEGSSLLCGFRNARGAWSESLAYGVALEIQRRLRMLHRWVDAYVAPSSFIATMLTRAGYPRNRIHTIYHGTPIDDVPSSGGDFALFAGRLSTEKGVETLVRASRLAPGLPIVVAGDGPLAALVQSEASASVSYLGMLKPAPLAQLRRRALFTIVPSEWFEVLSFSALESMAVGKPVVATALGALPEIVTDGSNGRLIPPKNPTALASVMMELWNDRTGTIAMGRRAWLYAREQFSPSQQARRLAELYVEVHLGLGAFSTRAQSPSSTAPG